MMATMTATTCLECHTDLGGQTGKDPFKHMVHCLKVEPDTYVRLRDVAGREWGERGRRVIHILDALERKDAVDSVDE